MTLHLVDLAVLNLLSKMKSLFYSLWKIAKFFMSFLKAQVGFPSNFSSLFSAIKSSAHFLEFLSARVKILNCQVSFFSNFASFFSVITHNSSVTFKLMHFLLLTKGSHQSPNFDTSNCCGEIAKLLMSFSKQQVSFSSNFAWQCHEK